MYGFSSFYWDVADLAERDRRAVEALDGASPPLPSAGYATHDPDGLLAAYRTLLHSDDPPARGVALDQYTYAEAQGRWGAANPLAVLDDDVLAEARAMLAVAPDPALPLAAQPRVTACWNSALGVLAFLTGDGGAADLPRIVEVLSAAFTEDLLDDTYAFWAVEVRLIDADPPTCERVGGWLAATAADPRLPVGVRVAAIGACGDERYAARLGQLDAIAGLLHDPEIQVAVHAARVLANVGGAWDERVRLAVAGWPDDAPYPAGEVRRQLAEADDLARAREVLAGPGDAAAVTAALDVLAEHGDASDLPVLLALVAEADGALVRAVAATSPERNQSGGGTEDATEDDVDAGFAAAVGHCLWGADDPLVLRVAEQLAAVFTDERVPGAVRALAIRPLWSGARPWGQTDALAGLLGHDDLRLSTAAALALAARPGAEALIRRAVAGWPDDAPYPAGEVRAALAVLDAVAAARDVVAAAADPSHVPPVTATALRDAVHCLQHDGDDDVDGPGLLALLGSDGLAVVFRGADPAQARELAGKLRAALRWMLADGAADPRYAPAADRLKELAPSMS